MKTVAWTPTQELSSAEFALDQEAYFYSAPAKVDKRMTLNGAILAGAAYAGMNLPFEIRSRTQETLAAFEPGQPLRAYPAVHAALMETAAHLDQRAKAAVGLAVAELKQHAIQLYEKGVEHGLAAASTSSGAQGDSATQLQGGVAPAAGAPETPTSDAVVPAETTTPQATV